MPPHVRAATGRPEPGEYAAYAQADFDAVPGDDAIAALEHARDATLALFAPLDEVAIRGLRYPPRKWTVKEVLGHLIADERIYAFRALSVARGDAGPLPGFDENAYVTHARFEERLLADLLAEYRLVRASTLALLHGLPDDAWTRTGLANGYPASARGLAFHIAAHELHHLRVLRERYLHG